MKNTKRNTLSRQEMAELYRDLRNTVATIETKKSKPAASKSDKELAKQIAQSISQSIAKDRAVPQAVRSLAVEESADAALRAELEQQGTTKRWSGHTAALVAVVFFAMAKLAFSIAETMGVLSVLPAHATEVQTAVKAEGQYSAEEVSVLTALDERRTELEKRRVQIEAQAEDLSRREREFVLKLAQLRELTDKLRGERDKDQRKRVAQLDQLANVYGAMNPQEAAHLLEQLDMTIALALMQRMPEKRVGQILGLMAPERALTITKMLSGTQQKG